MPILDSEIVWRTAALNSDTTPSQNGGRMTAILSASGVKNNLLPDVSNTGRLAGETRWRKAFIHVASAVDTPLTDVRIYIAEPTAGGDAVTLAPGTQTDAEDQIAGRAYGVVRGDVTGGITSLAATLEAGIAALQPFRAGDTVAITQGASVDWKTLTAATYSGDTVTLTFDAPLAGGGIPMPAFIASVIRVPSVQASISNWTETSAAGTYDELNFGNAVAHNLGSIEQNWTITFTSATEFTCTGDIVGALRIGNITGTYSEPNPALQSVPYFTLRPTGWGGTWAAGDRITFRTSPASIPLWYRRDVPAGIAGIANDAVTVLIQGESV